MPNSKSKRTKKQTRSNSGINRKLLVDLDGDMSTTDDVMSFDEWALGKQQEAAGTPDVKLLTAKVRELNEENRRLSKLLGLVESYHAAAGEAPKWMTPKAKLKPNSATACLQLSDLHLDEVVNPHEIGGLNAYSREIARMRLMRWASKACEMGERYKHAWDGAVVFWGGDMVSGAIHDELRETNEDCLPSSIVYWAPLLAAAIRQVADYYGRVHVPAIVGNHGRLTKEKPAKRRGRNSWDWLLVQFVQAHLKNDPRITFDIAEGTYLFVPIYDTYVYLTHGDEAGGGGGWAGVWSPLGTIHRRGVELAAAHNLRICYSVVGHWHQTVLAHHRGLSCNGSMKGWDEFAALLRLRPEPAMQNFFVHSPENGITMAAPLFLQDRKAEGW